LLPSHDEVFVLVSLRVAAIELDPRDGRPVLLLIHESTERCFPLWLGDDEAHAIARSIGRAPAATDAVDVIRSAIAVLGGVVSQVEITGALHRVVTAAIVVTDATGPVSIPSRASDAVALALRVGAPILVPEELLAQVAARVSDAETRTQSRPPASAEHVQLSQAERWNALLAHLSRGRTDKPYEG
jgi:bifunctional DNase/RNase